MATKRSSTLKAKATRGAAKQEPANWLELDAPINDLGYGISALSLIHDALSKDDNSELTEAIFCVYRSLSRDWKRLRTLCDGGAS